MKRITFLFALVVTAAAHALTVEQAVELYRGISALDQGAVKIIDGKPQTVPFQFSANTRWALAEDAAALKSTADAFQATSQATALAINPKGIPANDMAGQAAFAKAIAPVLQKEVTPPPALQKVALADLNLDANPLPTSVLVALKPIIQP